MDQAVRRQNREQFYRGAVVDENINRQIDKIFAKGDPQVVIPNLLSGNDFWSTQCNSADLAPCFISVGVDGK